MPYREPPPKRTKVLRFCLDVLAKPLPCPEPWDAMDGGECHRACPRCGETVTDVHAMDPAEAEAFLEERITRAPFLDAFVREDGRVMTKPCRAGLRKKTMARVGAVLAAAVTVGLLLAAR